MRLRYAKITTTGPVRAINQDWIDFWESNDPLVREQQGSVALIADGVGGYLHGEIASRLAVDQAIEAFKQAPIDTKPYEVLKQMFASACSSIYEKSNSEFQGKMMATTLVASLFRNRTVCIANVGDTRAYFIRQKQISRLTTDHVATALPVKLGLMLERQAMASPQRSQLTRTVGAEALCQPSFTTQFLHHGDYILHCTDGLHAYVLDDEMREIVTRSHPYDACKELVALAEKRGSDDNITLQIIEIRDWERVAKLTNPPAATTLGQSKQNASSATKNTSLGSDLTPGMLLDNRFELTDLVARSNMSSIFRATDKKNSETVAIKVPLLAPENDAAGFERFRREEEIGSKLNHPTILKVIKVEETKSRPYLVMEFLDGRTLSELLAKRKPISEPEAIGYATRICEALHYLNTQGITHRDLKPQNIMICKDGSVRLFDFGIARVESARRLTFVGPTPTMGTPDYISPEQVKGKRGDHRSDIYSLGALLYEMVTGATPFEGESPYVIMNARVTGDPIAPRKINPELSATLEEVLLHALERDPKHRYADALDMKKELEHLDSVVLTNRDQRLRAPQPWKSKGYKGLVIIAIILVQVLLFFLLMSTSHRHH